MVKNLAFIPLRSGSKGIPNKNIKSLNGRPLAYWVVKACVNSALIDKVVIATDSDIIWQEITKHIDSDKLYYFKRDLITATDNASTESVIVNFINKKEIEFTNLILVQATSPLLRTTHLDEGIQLVESGQYNSVLSAVREKRFIWEQSSQGYAPVNYLLDKRPRRQEFEGFLVENGAFYITSTKDFIKKNVRLNGNIGIVEMEPDSYFEIDEPSDWDIVESLHSKTLHKEYQSKIRKIKLIAFDVDGVLTDSGMYYTNTGDEIKKFNTRDGKAVEILKQHGYQIAIITSESTNIVINRANKLKIENLIQGSKNKLEDLEKLIKELGVNMDEVAYIGDDINDYDVLKAVGFSVCPKDAIECNLKIADYISIKNGGEGVIRDICKFFIK